MENIKICEICGLCNGCLTAINTTKTELNNGNNVTLFKEIPDMDAGLAASVFHFGEIKISELKKALAENGIPSRI